jgi:DNA repair exonuclease SbcCD ATPase subunit
MKIKSIMIRGFRGFNDEREIQFDQRLTLVSAVNSYGKTSISEGFEWLLYGQTSKVEKADSKDEYKGSYRNCHLPDGVNPEVALVLDDKGTENTLEAELVGDEIQRKLNGSPVSEWAFTSTLGAIPKPFILQHALKNLLLAKPVDRFNDFARLLGFEELGDLRKDIVALCTQYHPPQPIQQLISAVDALQLRVQAQTSFAPIAKELKKGSKGLSKAYSLIEKECANRLPAGSGSDSFLPQLLRMRNDAVAKIFKGSVALAPCSVEDQNADKADETILLNGISSDLTTKYSALIALKAHRSISDLASFYDLGIKLLSKQTTICPFCLQEITPEQRDHIVAKHSDIQEQSKAVADLNKHVIEIQQNVRELQTRLSTYFNRNYARCSSLLAVEGSLPQIEKLLTAKHTNHRDAITQQLQLLKASKMAGDGALQAAQSELAALAESVKSSTEDLAIVTAAGKALVEAVAAVHGYRDLHHQAETSLSNANEVLQHELDALAGTQQISVLIDLLEKRKEVEQRFQVGAIIEGLKDLRSSTEEFVGKRLLDAISGEFTDEVMTWYGKIRTTGDPDVHFAGFDMKKAASGNRVQIKATSYGRDLVSAVSSLSESKLNALGLCISIAINLKSESPFEFLIIDDPIQSWDQEHETKFIDVIRELVKTGKQVVLLSHNQQWIKQVRSVCDDLNGAYYNITGYTKVGPHIVEVPWAEIKQRMNVIDAILKNPDASPVELQHAEEEIRIVTSQLVAELNLKKFGVAVNTKNMNGDKVQKVLLACGVDNEFVAKVAATFGTVDPAHHAQDNYAVSRERVREYHGRATKLADIVTKTPDCRKKAMAVTAGA